MILRLLRNRPSVLKRTLSVSTWRKSEKDELDWLRPVQVKFDDAFAAMNEKIESGVEIENNPEITEMLSQLITGRKPPTRERDLRHREQTNFIHDLSKSNPSIRLHLVIFYQKYFPDLGGRHAGWRIKHKQFYSTEKMERDIEFNKKLLREKCNVEYDECLARVAIGCPLDSRWRSLQGRISADEVKEIEDRWSSLTPEEVLSFEARYRKGEFTIPKLPTLTIDALTEDGIARQQHQTVISDTIAEGLSSPAGREAFLKDMGKDSSKEKYEKKAFNPVVNYVEEYINNVDQGTPINGGILAIALRNGHIVSESKLYNAWLVSAIRRPALNIQHISEKSAVYTNLCKVRGYDPSIVKKVSGYRAIHKHSVETYITALDVYEKSQEKFKTEFVADTVERSDEDRKLHEEQRQKAKWDVIDKKNGMLRSKIQTQVVWYEMFRDGLSLPNLLSIKTPRDNAHIINTVSFKRPVQHQPKRATEILELLDAGGRANSRLTTGSSSRHLRGDLALLMRSLQTYIINFMEKDECFDFVDPPPLTFDYISEAITGTSTSPTDYKEYSFDNLIHLEPYQALSQIYGQFGI